MTHFVLVAGARLGAWAWDEVVPHLRAAGHGAHPLTLSGLAEKQGVPAGQQTHVRDIVDEIEGKELRDVVLVGHSYAGTPMSRSTAGRSSPPGRTAVRHGGFWPVAPAAHYAGQGLTDEQIARIVAGSTPHPGASLTEPAVMARPLGELPATYIHCLLDDAALGEDVALLLATGTRWRLVEMDTGHWPMFSRPRELARILLDAAGE
ncbi:alpha/beta hydrolase family protein [Streptomyces sp. NPDC049585]|uniref:alpha/beta fold hydrolase n=1 Tax=Streptomyces sp. NPDC049585 TaxID=3155154 RepID=UPI0034251C1A